MGEAPSDLEHKKYRLEIIKVLFSILTPIVVLWFGFMINNKLEKQKETIQQIQLRQQKIDLMEKIVPQLFDVNADDNKSLALMYLLRNIDRSMSDSIQILLIRNYSNQKQKNDTAQSNSLFNAAETFGGKLADTLKIINQNFKTATNLERQGVHALSKKSVEDAIKHFEGTNKVYPGFRQTDEITTYLIKNKDQLRDSNSNKWKEALKTIALDYKVNIPNNFKQNFK